VRLLCGLESGHRRQYRFAGQVFGALRYDLDAMTAGGVSFDAAAVAAYRIADAMLKARTAEGPGRLVRRGGRWEWID
jgi:hypothetical protein